MGKVSKGFAEEDRLRVMVNILTKELEELRRAVQFLRQQVSMLKRKSEDCLKRERGEQ